MSTKIYTAYKLHCSAMNRFMAKFDRITMQIAANKINKRLHNVISKNREQIESQCKSEYEKTKQDWLKRNVSYEDFATEERKNTIALDMTLLEVAKSSFSPYRDPFLDIDASFNAFIYNEDFYVIPYGEIRWEKQGFAKLKGVEDYCYWNNCEEPSNITYKDWEKRGKVWDKVACDNWEKNRLVHKAVDFIDGTNMPNVIEMATTKHETPIVVHDHFKWNTYKACYREIVEGEFWAKKFKDKDLGEL